LSPTPLKNDGVKVSWDEDIANMNGKIKIMLHTTNQMVLEVGVQFLCAVIFLTRRRNWECQVPNTHTCDPARFNVNVKSNKQGHWPWSKRKK
jgi:hypothetical protein